MNIGTSKRVIPAFMALAFAMLACNFGKAPIAETQPTEVEPTQTTQPETSDQGLCYNPLYPVKSGATWSYASSGSIEGDYGFTDSITDLRQDGFTLTSQFDQLTRTQEWSCDPEGLTSLTFGGGAAAGITTNEIQMDLTTSNVQGVNLPKKVNAGDQWTHSLDFKGTMEITGNSADVQGTANYAFNAVGNESVTVPAGTFEAMKIHVDMTLDMQISFSGIETPAQFSTASDVWYAPDVGWVKTSSSGDLMGTTYEETIELQSYNIP